MFVLHQADMLKNRLEKQLTIYLVSRSKAKKARPMMIVRQLHYKGKILNGKKISLRELPYVYESSNICIFFFYIQVRF